MQETRVENDRYAAIGTELVQTEPSLAEVAASKARIAFLESDAKKMHSGKTVFGECEKVPAKHKWCVPFDFTVTVYAPNVEGFTEAQLRMTNHNLDYQGFGSESEEAGGEELPGAAFGDARRVQRLFLRA